MKRINLLAAGERGRAWFWWGISLGSLAGLLLWWWLQQKKTEDEGAVLRVEQIVLPDDESEIESQALAEEKPDPGEVQHAPVDHKESSEPVDDLQLIEGIGPRSAQVLVQAGVTTFAMLSEMHPDSIQSILRAASVRVPYPETWPEQAALAAGERWDDLTKLQGTLKGGRRV